MRAVWGNDYDIWEDKCYVRPCCPECGEPIAKHEDSWYRCLSCGKVVEVTDPNMQEWFHIREETKIKYENCRVIKDKQGNVLSGCGGKRCVKTLYRRNPITLKWQCCGGSCEKCKTRFIV